MTIQPCLRCHRRKDCEIHKAKLKSVRGLGLNFIRFTCKIPEQDFPPGCRVRATVISRYTLQPWPVCGTVMRAWKKGILIAVDADSKEDYLEDSDVPGPESPELELAMGDVILVHFDRVKRLPDPGVSVCKVCGCPENRDDLKRRDGTPWGVCEGCEMLPAPVMIAEDHHGQID